MGLVLVEERLILVRPKATLEGMHGWNVIAKIMAPNKSACELPSRQHFEALNVSASAHVKAAPQHSVIFLHSH